METCCAFELKAYKLEVKHLVLPKLADRQSSNQLEYSIDYLHELRIRLISTWLTCPTSLLNFPVSEASLQ